MYDKEKVTFTSPITVIEFGPKNIPSKAVMVVQLVKGLTAKPYILSLIPWNVHSEKRELSFTSCPLTSTEVLRHSHKSPLNE